MKKQTEKDLNPFQYSDSNRRFHTYDYFLRQKFGRKVCKIPLDGGFTCPNIDGRRGEGGCIYCSSRGSGDFAASPSLPIAEQYSQVRAKLSQKWADALCIPYFQAHTNTYAPLERLKALYEEALEQPDAVGLAIATRADCITPEIADYLRALSERTFLTVELGLQTVHDRTASLINRCHTYAEFLEGYKMLEGIPVCIHLINGLPSETHEMMLDTVREVAKLKPFAIKLHLLHVLRGTPLAALYREGKYQPMTLEDYVATVCDQLELLPPETVIARVTGDGAADDLLAPLWSLRKFVVMNEIDKELRRRDSWQGRTRGSAL